MLKRLTLCFGMLLGVLSTAQTSMEKRTVKLFLAGDVMTGRGIDQALSNSVDPVLYEPYVKDARDYLLLAERASGDIKTPLSYEFIWGDALKVWKRANPDLKLVNLETSITTHNEPWPGKGINYRMHPKNVEVLSVAGIDHASLANNHTLDWKRPGLQETMKTLKAAGIKFSGVGENIVAAREPTILVTEKRRVLVFSYGSPSSGIPTTWAAEPDLSGVNLLPDLSMEAVENIRELVNSYKEAGDLAVFSVHWGGNWGYDVAEEQREFAQQLIEKAGIDLIFGHSSHHPLGMEVYKNKLIIYGAGDFINDYEGISGHEKYRGELSLMYFPELDPATGDLLKLEMVPMEIKKLSLHSASKKDAEWLHKVLDRESRKFGLEIGLKNGVLEADL